MSVLQMLRILSTATKQNAIPIADVHLFSDENTRFFFMKKVISGLLTNQMTETPSDQHPISP